MHTCFEHLRLLVALAATVAGLTALGPTAATAQTGHEGHDHAEGEQHQGPSGMELRELTQQASHPDQAAGAAVAIREHLLSTQLTPQYRMFLRRLLVRALIVSQAPVDEIIKQAEALAPDVPQQGGARVYFYAEVAQALIARNANPQKAVEFGRQALNEIPLEEAGGEVEIIVRGVLGRAHLANGDCKPAIKNLNVAVAVLPDSQPWLFDLGSAHELCGDETQAIGYYIRSMGVFMGQDHSADEPLRALYAKQHGSLDGLDERIAAARAASVEKEVFASRRYEIETPHWALEDFDGKLIDSDKLRGKIVVLDFWGSWCGPCRMELPHFQAVYEKYKAQGVIFYGVNWERVSREKRKATAQAYMEQNGFDFPVVVDMQDKTPQDFQVASFPTVFLIDPAGKIRYRNIGFSDAISDILTLQIDSLIAERDGKKSAKK